MIRRWKWAIVLLFALNNTDASIRYQSVQERVQGQWTLNAPGDYTIVSDAYRLDANQDGVIDLGFTHTFLPQAFSLSPAAVARLHAANDGALEIRRMLHDARGFAAEAASTTAGQEPLVRVLNERFRRRLDRIGQLADFTQFEGQLLLNGNAGVDGITSDPDTQVLAMTAHGRPGNYGVEITTSGKGAMVSAPRRQTEPLAQDEMLAVNGVLIPLDAGFSQADVISRINEFTHFTGVIADEFGANAATRLYTRAFGSSEEISATANKAAVANSSGFGTRELTSTGADLVVRLGGSSYQGDGRILVIDHGNHAGFRLSFAKQGGINDYMTVIGHQGNVIVTDSRLMMDLHPSGSPRVDFALPSLETEALGIGVHNNPFDHLHDVQLGTAINGQDALGVVDQAISEVDHLIASVADFLDVYAHPDGKGYVEAISGIRFAERGGEIRLLEQGELIGPTSQWSSERLVSASHLRDVGHDPTDFLGIELTIAGRAHYGWIGLEIDEQYGMLIRDAAIELSPGVTISAGAVPEPRVPVWYWCLVATLVLRIIR